MKVKRTRHDYFYFQNATRYLVSAVKLREELFSSKYLSKLKKTSKDLEKYDKKIFTKEELTKIHQEIDLPEYLKKIFQLKSSSTSVFLFSALCLESLINDYCVIKKSSNYFEKYIEKLNLLSKWVVVPKIITGQEFNSNSKAILYLNVLYKTRNNLVHPKSKKLNFKSPENNDLIPELTKLVTNIDKSYRAIIECTKELYTLDTTFEYLEDYKFLWCKENKFKDISNLESFYSMIINDYGFS